MFQKGRYALSGKVGGLKDDIVICLQLGIYWTESARVSAYSASKFAITGLTQSTAKELGKSGIRVNAICPVLIETPGLIEALKSENSPSFGQPTEFLEQFALTQTALGRLPNSKDVAELCYFLTSESANAITGQSINVDCGVLPN